MLAALVTSWLFAVTAGCARKVACAFGSIQGNLLRLSMATVLTGVCVYILGMPMPGAAGFLLSGLLGFGFGGGLMYLALPRLGSAAAMLLVQTGFVVFSNLGEWIWLGRVPGIASAVPTAAILLGIALNLLPRITSGHIAGNGLPIALAVTCALGSALGQAAGALVARATYLSLRSEVLVIHPLAATHVRLCGGLALALIAFAALRVAGSLRISTPQSPDSMPSHPYRWAFANVLTGPILGVACYQYALSQAPVSIVAPIVALAPVWAESVARGFGERTPKPSAILGTCLAVLGAVRLLTM